MQHDKLMETAVDILENGTQLPQKVTNQLVAGMVLHSFNVGSEGKKKAEKNEKRIIRLEALAGLIGSIGALLALLSAFGIL